MDKGEIILYQPDNSIQLEVRMEEDTVWLTQQQMALLFDTTKQNISLHVNNIFKEGELKKESVVKFFLTTAKDGKKIPYVVLQSRCYHFSRLSCKECTWNRIQNMGELGVERLSLEKIHHESTNISN